MKKQKTIEQIDLQDHQKILQEKIKADEKWAKYLQEKKSKFPDFY